MPNKKISDLTAKGAILAANDLIEIAESDGQGGYNSKSVTGSNVLSSKQDTLVSGTNIKTINSTTLLGAGDFALQPTLQSGTNIKTINSTTLLGAGDVAVQPTLVSGTNIKTVNNTTLLGSGNIAVQDPITLTTTGSSGASTLIGTTLNIPQYSGATPSGVSGAIQFTDGTNFSSDATNLFFDNTNDRLGVGQNVPTARVHIKGTGATTATTSLLVENSGGTASLQCTDDLSVFSHGKGAVATNTVYGKGALQGTTVTGANNVAIGVSAFGACSTGNTSVAIGSDAMKLAQTTQFSVAIGYSALSSTTGTQSNVAIGYDALKICTNSNNTAIGFQAGVNISSGGGNTFVGKDSGKTFATGSNNIAIGNGQTGAAGIAGTIMIGVGDTATGSNQCRFGSTTVAAGAVTAEVVAQANTWSVFINGVARKILLA